MPTAHQPNNNAESDVVAAVFALERVDKAPLPIQTTVDDVRHQPVGAVPAAPRRRRGGFGQRTSLIVGLGDYSGGALVVERVEKDIRYAPLEFDGWRERHWTLPFKGERFSLVWFTPLTVATGTEAAAAALRARGRLHVGSPAPPSVQQTIELLAPGCVVVRGLLDAAKQRDVITCIAGRAFEARAYDGGGAHEVPDGVPRGKTGTTHRMPTSRRTALHRDARGGRARRPRGAAAADAACCRPSTPRTLFCAIL